MSYKSLSRDRRRLVARLERDFARIIRQAEQDLSVRLGSEIAKIAVDEKGNIRPTVGNIQFNRRLNRVFKDFRQDRQRGIMSWLVASFRKLLGLNRRYFTQIKRGAPHDEVLRKVLLSLGYDIRTRRVMSGSWMDDLSRATTVKQTITRRVTGAILGGLSLAFLSRTVRALLRGPGGLLRRFFERQTRDIFIQVDGRAQNAYAVALELNHALYSGTIKDNTRPFCRARVQNVYTRKEVEKWQNQDWQGKIPGADVKEVCGGYNCRHHLSWVSSDIAERLAKGRGINHYS